MAFMFLRIVFVLMSLANWLEHIFCIDERILIDLRNGQVKVLDSGFSTYDEVITFDQIKMFQLDGDRAKDAWQRMYPERGRPSCAVLRGICCVNGEFPFKNGLHETRVNVSLRGVEKIDNNWKLPGIVEFFSPPYTNNNTKKIKWTPPKIIPLINQVNRTHSTETTDGWSLEGVTSFINVISSNGWYDFQSEWSQNTSHFRDFRINVDGPSEVDVNPGETIRSYIKYTERLYTIQLFYRMTINDYNTFVAMYDKPFFAWNGELYPRGYYSTNPSRIPGGLNEVVHMVKLDIIDAVSINHEIMRRKNKV